MSVAERERIGISGGTHDWMQGFSPASEYLRQQVRARSQPLVFLGTSPSPSEVGITRFVDTGSSVSIGERPPADLPAWHQIKEPTVPAHQNTPEPRIDLAVASLLGSPVVFAIVPSRVEASLARITKHETGRPCGELSSWLVRSVYAHRTIADLNLVTASPSGSIQWNDLSCLTLDSQRIYELGTIHRAAVPQFEDPIAVFDHAQKNRRRAQLIAKDTEQHLTPEEHDELNALETEAEAIVHKLGKPKIEALDDLKALASSLGFDLTQLRTHQ